MQNTKLKDLYEKDTLLLKIVEQFKVRYAPHTAILYGSRARDSYNDKSDYDILFVVDGAEPMRVNDKVGDFYLDIFIKSTLEIQNPTVNHLYMHDGLVLFEKDQFGENFLKALKDIYEEGPKPISEEEKKIMKNWSEKMLERMFVGDLESDYRAHELLISLLSDYFKVRAKWYEGSKKSLRWLSENDFVFYSTYKKALKNHLIPDIQNVINLVF
jgi:predicted nucleotidyltransferase